MPGCQILIATVFFARFTLFLFWISTSCTSIRVQRRYEGWYTPRPCMEFANCTAFRFLAFEQLQFRGLSHI
eukprot:s905_g16.t1